MSASGKPLPDDGLGAITSLTVAVLFSGATFMLVAGQPRRMGGARHSVKLEFEQQKIQMQQLAEDEEREALRTENAETNSETCHE